MIRFIKRLISKIFYEKGTYYGKMCSGFFCYPDDTECLGCNDCKNK